MRFRVTPRGICCQAEDCSRGSIYLWEKRVYLVVGYEDSFVNVFGFSESAFGFHPRERMVTPCAMTREVAPSKAKPRK